MGAEYVTKVRVVEAVYDQAEAKRHNILNQHWEGTLASPNMQQTRKIKNTNVECMADPMGPHLSDPCCSCKHQVAISSSMNNCGTKHRVMLPTSKLNSSDSQVWGAGIFSLPLQQRVTPALFKNVMEGEVWLWK
jgi:hypothetical protein